MKRTIGSVLIVLSIIGMAATALWTVLNPVEWPENPTERDRTTFVTFLLFAGLLFTLEVVLLLCGQYLCHPSPRSVAEQKQKWSGPRLMPLFIYLTASTAIAVLATLGTRVLPQIDALGFLMGQPHLLTQLILGIIGIRLDGGATTHVVRAAANLLYFSILFYPAYRIATIDRAVEAVAYRRMKVLLTLFVSVHILTAMILAMLVKA